MPNNYFQTISIPNKKYQINYIIFIIKNYLNIEIYNIFILYAQETRSYKIHIINIFHDNFSIFVYQNDCSVILIF